MSRMDLFGNVGNVATGWPQKSKPLPNDQKSYKIVSKPSLRWSLTLSQLQTQR